MPPSTSKNSCIWFVLLHLWHEVLNQSGWSPIVTITQHDTQHVASLLHPDLSGIFKPLINHCRLASMYWSCLGCSKPRFTLDCIHFGTVYNENVLSHMWLQRELWHKTVFFFLSFLFKLAGSGPRSVWPVTWKTWLTLKSQVTSRVAQIWSLNRTKFNEKKVKDITASMNYEPDIEKSTPQM